MNKETEITQRIRLHLQEKFPGILLWRNSIGFDSRARVYYGIGGTGGSDLVGMWQGFFVGIEVKRPGARAEPVRLAEQTNFIRAIKEGGGKAGFATSPEEAEDIIRS